MNGFDTGFLSQEPTRYQAQCRPDHVACVALATGERLTYRALDARVARCGAQLRALPGGAQGVRVAFLGRNSIDNLVLNLACHRAGAVFVPLNWRLTGTELKALIADCAPGLLIHDAEFELAARAAGEGAAGLQCCERTQAAIFSIAAADPPLPVPLDPAAPCTLLYTSGTTGRPKGAIITRAGMFFSALNFAFVAELGPDCTILSDAPMFHTVGLVATLRTAMTVGATLVMSDRFQPDATLRALSDPDLNITHYFAVPRIAAALRDQPEFAGADLSRLRAIFVGGAPLSRALVEGYLARGVRIVNGYGMTECGTIMHMPIDAAMLAARPGAVGLPAPLMDVRLVGPDGHDAATGEAGEVWLRGPAVTPGYWNNPQATAASFSDGWFRTGDLARRDDDGFHWLVDRLKDMYISGGENVYPAELENVLWDLPGVADVAVLGVADPVWGESGVAFVVPHADAALTGADVLAFCAARLARYKHPSSIIFVDAIPRTASGKIQRHVLRQMLSGAISPASPQASESRP